MKKRLAMILMISMIMQTTLTGYAEIKKDYKEFSDIKGHWAQATIEKHHAMGMLSGYPDGSFKPDQQMKRSELITLVNKYFGLKEGSNQNYEDIEGKEWYAGETSKAKYYGYIEDLEARPEELASREDVINMMSLIIDVEEQKQESEKKEFKDLEGMNEEEQSKIENFSKMGYISGYEDGTFKPKGIINRAEIMSIVENMLGYIVTSQEDIDNMPEGVTKITIINPNITIENKEIKGDLYIAPGVNGKVTIKNTKIHGQIDVSGGTTEKPIQLENVEVEKIVITKVKETPKVTILGKSKINEIKVKAKTDLEIAGETEVDNIDVQAKTKLALKENTKIKNLNIEKETEVDTDKGIEIQEVKITGETKINGEGTIKKAIIDTDKVEIEKRPDYVKVENDNNVKIGGKENITKENDDDKEQESNGSSGSSGSSNKNKNAAPNALDDTATVKENDTVLIDVLANDTDADKDTLTISTMTQGINGAVTQEGNKLKYTPNKDYTGIDSFAYTIKDTHGAEATGKVTLTITDVDNLAPNWVSGYPYVLKTDADELSLFTKLDEKGTVYYSVYESGEDLTSTYSVSEFASYAKENDWMIEIEDFQNEYKTVSETVYGQVYGHTDDYKVYFLAEDQYKNLQNEITVVDITKVPLTDCDGSTGDQPAEIKITANTDADKIYYIVVNSTSTTPSATQIKAGKDSNSTSAVKSGSATSLTNTPITDLTEGNYYDIYFMAEDNKGNVSNIQKVSNIKAAVSNIAPVGTDDTATVNENDTVLINVLANDIDADNDTISISDFTNPSHGNLVKEGTKLKYTPNTNFAGEDSFTYTISDGNGGDDTATMTITVIDQTAPTVTAEYFASSDTGYTAPLSGPFKEGTNLVVRVTLNEPIKDTPTLKIAMNGVANVDPSNMTKEDTTHYVYTYTVPSGDGTQNIVLSNAEDVDGNGITATPTSGDHFTIDNTAPTIISAELVDGEDEGGGPILD